MSLPAPDCAYKFDATANEWRPVPAGSSAGGVDVSALPSLRLATFNVLADCFPPAVEVMISSEQRIPALVKAIEDNDGTVVGLNEVTGNILGHLLASPFIRANYFVSEIDTTGGKKSKLGKHGCVLLSKLPMECVYSFRPTDHPLCRRVVTGLFRTEDGTAFAIAAQHTQAYQTEDNFEIRRQQIRSAVATIKAVVREHGSLSGAEPVVLMGDLNMHYICEDSLILENGMCDAWAETRHDPTTGAIEDGFTYDSKTNGLIPRYVPGENRRMRLDRILCSPSFLRLFSFLGRCQMWGHECINDALKLHISDHYGLFVDIQRSTTAAATDYSSEERPVRKVMQANAALPRNKSTFTKWHFGLALPGHAIAMAKRKLLGW